MPKKRSPFAASSFARRSVFGKCSLPASTSRSPFSSNGTSFAIVSSTIWPALTSMMIRRGLRSDATNGFRSS